LDLEAQARPRGRREKQATLFLSIFFVLYGPKGIIGIGVKRGDTVNSKDLKGLRLFGEDYPEAKLFFFYGGKRREFHDKIQVIPLEEALPTLPALLGSEDSTEL